MTPKHGKPTDEDWRAFFASQEQMERGKEVIEAAVRTIRGHLGAYTELKDAVRRYEESNQ